MFRYRYDYDTDSFIRDGIRTEIIVPVITLVLLAIATLVH